jgi:hypothetical protein|tara:strand:- start:324 stop:602 length:279 start_codon:yes stop_codon:yes gene_type:complete
LCIPGVGSTGINTRKILLTASGGKMDKYFFTLDLLFRSNWDVSKPASLRSLMKKYLNRDHDVVGGADYIINIYKGDYLDKYTGDAREALMEL